MFNVICSLPNATHLINGVPFVDFEDGSIITDPPVDDETAALFRPITGYTVIDLDARTAPPPVTDSASLGRGRPSKEQVDAWLAEIKDLGGEVPAGTTGKAVHVFLTSLQADIAAKAKADGDAVVDALVAVVDAIPSLEGVEVQPAETETPAAALFAEG